MGMMNLMKSVYDEHFGKNAGAVKNVVNPYRDEAIRRLEEKTKIPFERMEWLEKNSERIYIGDQEIPPIILIDLVTLGGWKIRERAY